jgi:mediator of RNA polymerase II transcription subunit 16
MHVSRLPVPFIAAPNNRQGRKLAWSNTGSIARISPDGLKVTFRVFVEDPKTGAWAPGKESPHPILATDGSHFVHVQFSKLGHDLAVVDDVGLVHMFIAPTGLGRMHASTTDFAYDRAGRSGNDAVAGLHWLSVWPGEFKVSRVSIDATLPTC